jgi:DNA-directed RNA polymerase subunit RPC12/RpoP
MEEEIVFSCIQCGRLFNVSGIKDKALFNFILDLVWDVEDFARHFKCWRCLQSVGVSQAGDSMGA